jgi:hypothetical protein
MTLGFKPSQVARLARSEGTRRSAGGGVCAKVLYGPGSCSTCTLKNVGTIQWIGADLRTCLPSAEPRASKCGTVTHSKRRNRD